MFVCSILPQRWLTQSHKGTGLVTELSWIVLGNLSWLACPFHTFSVHFSVVMTVGLHNLSPAIQVSFCPEADLISVEFRFEGSFRRNAQVVRLRLGEFGEVDSQVI